MNRVILFLLLAVVTLPAVAGNIASNYQDIRAEANQSKRHAAALGVNDQAALLYRAVFRQLAPNWYGTRWSFNGHTELPQNGSIACGYFVSTLLRDAGLKVQRVKLAQQPSEWIIQSLVGEKYIKRFRRQSLPAFVESVRVWGKGLYVVGLDNHTGFVVHDGNRIWFVHASYLAPYQVVREPALSSAALAASHYRVLGKLADPVLLQAWVDDRPIDTRQH